jgi:hypothetical protein
VPDAEQSGGAAGDAVGEVGGVFGGSIGGRVVEPAPVGVQPAHGLQPSPLLPQPARRGRGRDGFDVLDEVDPAGQGQQHLGPTEGELGRVSGDDHDRRITVPDRQKPRCDLDTSSRSERPWTPTQLKRWQT